MHMLSSSSSELRLAHCSCSPLLLLYRCCYQAESALCFVVSALISNSAQQHLRIDWLDGCLFASAPKYSTSRRLPCRCLIKPARGGAAHAIEVHTSRREMLQKFRTEAAQGALFPQRLKLVVPTVTWLQLFLNE